MTDNVKVAIRCRPLSQKEIADGYNSIVEFEGNNKVIVEGTNDQPGSKTGDTRSFLREYQFDQVFDWNSSQEQVYDKSCRPIVNSVLEGYNGTIFAYGQTGTGKTYTMEGLGGKRKMSSSGSSPSFRKNSASSIARRESHQSSETLTNNSDDYGLKSDYHDEVKSMGVIPRTFKHIFQHIAEHPEIQFLVRVSYLEIYQENIHDLLRKDQSIKLELHERPDIGVYVKDLTSFFCKSITEIERVMKVGNQNRRVAATDMNEHSSRSHAIFMITIEQQLKLVQEDDNDSNININQRKDGKMDKNNQSRIIKVGKLNLIDLAGSESQKKTNSFGQRQKESVKINLSLSALGNVINSLMKANTQYEKQQQSNNVDGANGNNKNKLTLSSHHTPYRDSKLTRLLQDSLGGNAKTLMIANIGPASYNYDETINTLNYASRAKLIRNKPRLNEDPKDALLRELQKEIDDLRQKLAELDANPMAPSNDNHANKQQQKAIMAQRRKISNDDINNKSKNTNRSSTTTSNNNDGNANHTNDDNEAAADHDDQRLIAQELIDLKQKLASLESKLLNNDDTNLVASIKSNKQTNMLMAQNRQSKNDNYDSDKSGNLNSNTENRQLPATDLLENYMRKQEEELDAKLVELANQTSRESAIRDELEKKEEIELLTKESYSSTQHELEAKKRLIRQILVKVKQMRDTIEHDENTYRLELDELDQLQYELNKELKLKCLIMDNFIPNYHVNQLLPRILYDEQSSDCFIKPINLPPDKCVACIASESDNSTDCVISYADFWKKITAQSGGINSRTHGESSSKNNIEPYRPKSEFERLEETLFPGNIRFKCDQFIECQTDQNLELKLIKDRPNLISDDYQPNDDQIKRQQNAFPQKLQELLNESLDMQEPDIVI